MSTFKNILKSIRKILISIPSINTLVYYLCLDRAKKNNFNVSKLVMNDNKLEYSTLFNEPILHLNKVCHIICSGHSFNASVQHLDKDDFIIGFNFAGIIKLNYSIYFIELASNCNKKIKNISDCQYRVVQESLNSKSKLIFKNIYSEAVPQSKYLSKYKNFNVLFARDYQIPILSKALLHKSVSSLLEEANVSLLPQLRSTIYTAIAYAYRQGFKEIVVHGLDFGGPHFFDAEDFAGSLENRPSYDALPKIKMGDNHLTNIGEVSSIDILKEINRQLKAKGVTLYAAIENSKLSEYLPVYYSEAIK